MENTGHYQHPCKCMNCGLHFIACSWSEVWPREEADDDSLNFTAICPECGSDALVRWAPRKVDEFIFQVVPGEQTLVSMNMPTQLSNDPATS